jgi:hypothetical protein
MADKTSKPDDKAAPREDQCAGHALGFPLRSELGFNAIENLTLDLFRCACEIYTSGSAQPWEMALKLSEENIGAGEGPVLVARITALLRALRAERKLGFSYLSVGCQHVSPDELAVAGLLKAARSRDENGVQRGLMLSLDKPQSAHRTLNAARSLAALQVRLSSFRADAESVHHDFDGQTIDAIYLH